ncbi:OsmC family peroxiredoxin [Candidatus Paracaedibacter symbiosus]|uniref:OsmC family peroxiredoxin n=1 Tax=Candidatus Paracaedibacter symbiosus TaxID=244582 RepID=UPI000509C0FD|nr:OsmC family peroxiredoxin [Candidatus Paracaedibacter symbiosus]
MAIIRHSNAKWQGDVMAGSGHISFGSGAFSGPYSFKDRTADQSSATNPEELIAAAHAGCFSMAISAALTQEGFKNIEIATTAKVHLSRDETGFTISQINLETQVSAANIGQEKLQEIVEFAKKNCPVSKALAAVPITLKINGHG